MRLLLGSLVLLLALNCQHARLRFDGCADCKGGTDPSKTQELHHKFYVWGLVGKQELYARDLCPGSGISEIYQYTSAVDGILENLTLGMYMPRTLRITCN